MGCPRLVYADWCGPCAMIAPYLRETVDSLVSAQRGDVRQGRIPSTSRRLLRRTGSEPCRPFIVFRDGNEVDRGSGCRSPKLQAILKKLNTEIESAGNAGESSISGAGASASTGTGPVWRGAELPRGYKDITDQVEIPRCELLNVDSDVGGVRVLFAPDKPWRH